MLRKSRPLLRAQRLRRGQPPGCWPRRLAKAPHPWQHDRTDRNGKAAHSDPMGRKRSVLIPPELVRAAFGHDIWRAVRCVLFRRRRAWPRRRTSSRSSGYGSWPSTARAFLGKPPVAAPRIRTRAVIDRDKHGNAKRNRTVLHVDWLKTHQQTWNDPERRAGALWRFDLESGSRRVTHRTLARQWSCDRSPSHRTASWRITGGSRQRSSPRTKDRVHEAVLIQRSRDGLHHLLAIDSRFNAGRDGDKAPQRKLVVADPVVPGAHVRSCARTQPRCPHCDMMEYRRARGPYAAHFSAHGYLPVLPNSRCVSPHRCEHGAGSHGSARRPRRLRASFLNLAPID